MDRTHGAGEMTRRRQRGLPSLARLLPRARHHQAAQLVDGRRAAKRESGSVLILALVFVLIVGIVIAALSTLVANGLSNSVRFASSRSLQYAASSAVSQAIEDIRYAPLIYQGASTSPTLNASPPVSCWGPGQSQVTNINGVASVSVWCSTAWSPTSAQSRVVTISACATAASATACAAQPLLQVVVTFDDYPPGTSAPNTALCNVYCGTGMTIDSWAWSPVVPVVSTVTVTGGGPATGPTSGGTPITVNGSGFIAGSTINFVEERNGIPTTNNVVLPATSVVYVSPTQMTAVSPAITAGTTYFVTVTTSTGTSPFTSAGPIFAYSSVIPVVTSATLPAGGTPGGPTSGGTLIQIQGTGFFGSDTVQLVRETGGVADSPTVAYAATNVTISSSTTITAVTPSVLDATTYFVTVTTPRVGTSAPTRNGVFTAVQYYPLVSSVSPTSGPTAGGTAVTITGTGFATGATVQFVQETNNTVNSPLVSVNATNVVVSSPSLITAVTPSVSGGGSLTYFVYVTCGSSHLQSSNTVVFTF